MYVGLLWDDMVNKANRIIEEKLHILVTLSYYFSEQKKNNISTTKIKVRRNLIIRYESFRLRAPSLLIFSYHIFT